MTDYVISTPLGEMVLTSDGTALCEVNFVGSRYLPSLPDRQIGEKNGLFEQAAHEFALYFAGKLREFTVPLRLVGTPFQQKVWAGIAEIPYGRLTSYGELAAKLKTGARAVGSATGRNPISIIIPCHRVVGYDGAITGYGGGLDGKRALLTLEGISIEKDTCFEAR
jgi:methylated-DNA-[protein]-cysteine S-methyltransferase